jgi:hypothetical protein
MRCGNKACVYNDELSCTDTNNIHKCDNWKDKDLVFGETKPERLVGEKGHVVLHQEANDAINAIFSVLTDDQKKAVRRLL